MPRKVHIYPGQCPKQVRERMFLGSLPKIKKETTGGENPSKRFAPRLAKRSPHRVV